MLNSLLVLLLATGGFFSQDKILHFSYSAGMTGLSNHIMVNQLGIEQERSRNFSISLSTAMGIGKELYDLKKGEKFDFQDVVWDILGIGIGYLLFIK